MIGHVFIIPRLSKIHKSLLGKVATELNTEFLSALGGNSVARKFSGFIFKKIGTNPSRAQAERGRGDQ